MTNDRFTSGQVVSLTGITPRQLQWWDERGIVVPVHEGHRRLYSPEDLAEVAVICVLKNRGFSLQRIRKVMRVLQKELGKRLVETVAAGSDYHLLTDGIHIYLETSAKQIVDVLKNSRQPMLTVCLSDTVRQVMPYLSAEAAVARLPRQSRNGSRSPVGDKAVVNKGLVSTPARGATRTGPVSSAALRRGRTL